MRDVLSNFGEILMNDIRDRTIHGYDMRITGKMRDESSQKLFGEVQQLNDSQRQLIERIIPQIVDLSIHNMLCMVEEHSNIDVQMDGESISEISDGLAGELYSEDGWIQRFSNQRYEEV